ncbi:MAG: hypothetical protein ACM3SS_19230 [Rhodospirillaceae bacterium]
MIRQNAHWDNAFKHLAASDEWNKELRDNHMTNTYRDSAGTTRYIAQQYSEIKEILEDLGLARAAQPR